MKIETQYYRTFIGLPVKVSDGILEARQELLECLTGERISWVDPERFHITLRFLGNTQVSMIRDINQALKNGIKVPKKSHIMLTHPGSFGPRKRPRVIWVGFESSTLFEMLKSDIDQALESCGIPLVDQPFRAHLTLGRLRSIKDLNGFHNAVAAMKDRFSDLVEFNRLVFYRSELGKGGPVYTPLYQVEFKE